MITHTTAITLDISCSQPRAEVKAKQDDSSTRFVKANFIDNGAAVSLAQVTAAELRVLRPDGKMTVTAATISGGYVTAELTENALAVAGRGYGDIRLKDGDGKVISAARFVLKIEPSAVSNSQITASSEFRIFETELAELSDDLAAFRAQYAYQMSQLSSELWRFGGLRFKKLTKSEYESLEPDPSTVYYVTDEKGGVTQYFGAVKLTSGVSTAGDSVTLSDGTAAAVSGASQSLEED